MKRILSIILTILLLTSIAAVSSVPVSAAVDYKGKTVSEVLGMDTGIYLNWLKSHENDNYYIGTPYGDGDYRNPKGDCAGAYGYSDIKGKAAMNCTGFVWHVLYKATKASGGNTSIIPALGRQKWLDFYENDRSITRHYFSSKSEMLNSGYLSKGDIIWMYVDGDEYTPMDEHHIGIYWGDGHSDVLWHSSDDTGTNVQGNVIAKIRPKLDYNTKYMVLKVGSKPVVKVIKKSANTNTTSGNSNYTFKGITYCFYKSTNSFVTGSSNPDYVGYIELDENGEGYSFNGSNSKIKNIGVGTYYVREDNDAALKASGYQWDDTVYTVEVKAENTADNPAVLRVTDEPHRPSIKIEKFSTKPEFTEGNSNYTFKGITYCVYKSTDSFVTGSSNPDYVGYIELDENGEGYSINGSNSRIKNIGLGTYYVREDNDAGLRASGYQWNDTVYTIQLTKDYDLENPYVLRVEDEPKGIISAKIVKKSTDPELTDGNTCYSLEGAVFNVYTSKPNARAGTNPLFENLTTDTDGVAYIPEIAPGTYYVKEIYAPKGFKLSDEIGELKVDAGSEGVCEVPMYDQPLIDPVKVLLHKRNAVTGETTDEKLNNAEYTFKYYDGIYTTEDELRNVSPARTWVFKTYKGLIEYDISYMVSGDELFPGGNFPLGTVTIKETKAPVEPVPFYLDDTLYIINIDENEDKTVKSYNVPISNEYPMTGSVILNKVDEHGEPMTDYRVVKFALYAKNGEPIGVTSTDDGYSFSRDLQTDDNEFYISPTGSVTITNLPVGDYYFKELETKEGYMPINRNIEFTVSSDSVGQVTVTAQNNRLLMPNTGGIGNTVIYIFAAIVALIALGLAAIYFVKKNKQKKERRKN